MRKCLSIQSVLVAVIILLANGNLFAQYESSTTWYDDIENAKQVAAKENKNVLLHFWAPWCQPCKDLDKFVFTSPVVKKALQENVVAVKINVDLRQDLGKEYNVQSIPQEVVITPAGHVVARRPSPSSADAYVRMLEGFTNRKPSAASQLAAMIENKSSSFANRIDETAQDGLNSFQQNVAKTQQVANEVTPIAEMANLNGGGKFGGGNFQSGNTTSNAKKIINNKVKANESMFAAETQRLNQAATDLNSKVENKFAQSNVDFEKAASDFQAKMAERTAELKQSIEESRLETAQRFNQSPSLQPTSSELGIEGYCPVSLINGEKWVKGNKQWGCLHRGKTYLFTSKENRDLFQMAPDAFSPLLAGYDPVIFHEKGELVRGSRSKGAFFGGNDGPKIVVLFQDQQTREKFEKEPSRYIKAVRQAMSQVDRDTVYR